LVAGFLANGFADKVPEPAVAKMDPEYDLLEWCCTHWGTKWNVPAEDLNVTRDEQNDGNRTVKIDFDTAWSPPIAWLRTIAELYLDRPLYIKLSYIEPAMCFCGAVEFSCEHKSERITTGSLGSDDPFETVAYRNALIEFDSDAAIDYEVVANISGGRLPITPQVAARYRSVVGAKDALACRNRQEALDLIGAAIRSTFDPTKVKSALLSQPSEYDSPGGHDSVQTEVENLTFDGDVLVVSAQARFSVAFGVPFVSLRDFYATCKNSNALSKGVRLWLEDLEFEEYQLITVQPAASNWKARGLTNLDELFEKDGPDAD
jgi:hypothetical protein